MQGGEHDDACTARCMSLYVARTLPEAARPKKAEKLKVINANGESRLKLITAKNGGKGGGDVKVQSSRPSTRASRDMLGPMRGGRVRGVNEWCGVEAVRSAPDKLSELL